MLNRSIAATQRSRLSCFLTSKCPHLSTLPKSPLLPPPVPTDGICGVLFDLDGTLVDSEFLSPLAWAQVLHEMGVMLGPHDRSVEQVMSAPALRGARGATIAEVLAASHCKGMEVDLAWMAQRKREFAVELVTSHRVDLSSLWFPGVPDAVRRLGAALGGEHRVGLCTSNLPDVVFATLAAGGGDSGMADAFGGGLTMQKDVAQLKPSPEPYLRALELLCVPGQAVAVLEDSVVGVQAARAAGVGTVIGVLNCPQPPPDLEGKGEEEEATLPLSSAGRAASVETAVLSPDELVVAEELWVAGASGVFRTTVEAIAWCEAHARQSWPPLPRSGGPGGTSTTTSTNGSSRQHTEEEFRAKCLAKEAVVQRYFEGVNTKDRELIASCFSAPPPSSSSLASSSAEEEEAQCFVELRDMCGPSKGAPFLATPAQMADRVMEFVGAHPDCVVSFESPPRADREGSWVWAHWVETGTWSGHSRGLAPSGKPMENIGGHTRFMVEQSSPGGAFRISKQVVYRTYTEWEIQLREQ